MTENKKILPYHKWDPVLTPEQVYTKKLRLSQIKTINKDIFWLEGRAEEDGRNVIVHRDEKNNIQDITPPNFYVRNRVHEYGGGAYDVDETYVYFTNFEDQRIYKQNWREKSEPVPLTPERNKDGSLGKYAALMISPDRSKLAFVYEKEYEEKENRNYIAFVSTDTDELNEPVILVSGCDFYSDPVIAPSGKEIAWIQWNHPNMPWDKTELARAKLSSEGLKPNSTQIIGDDLEASICCPGYNTKGELFFILDEAKKLENDPRNWWNIYSWRDNEIYPITQELKEYAVPQWVFGISNYDFLPEGKIIARNSEGELNIINPENKKITKITNLPYTSFSYVKTDKEGLVYFIGASPKIPAEIVQLDLNKEKYNTIKKSSHMSLETKFVSIPQLIKFPTQDNEFAYAQYYKPKNPNYRAPVEDLPPLIIMVHGGPTGRASTMFSAEKQFWTSQGYALIDVDHRGSTGYGRKYRDALLGKWGIIDPNDVKNSIDYLKDSNLVANKIAIRGGSAGGYEVQRVLTLFPELIQVGASYFGIGDLITLVKLTHKFESKYVEKLIGVKFEKDKKEYEKRSPITDIDKLKASMILFQGAKDKIVTPENSREIVKVLKEKGIKHEYIEYEDETHGFRKKESNIDALTKEAEFYKEVLYNL